MTVYWVKPVCIPSAKLVISISISRTSFDIKHRNVKSIFFFIYSLRFHTLNFSCAKIFVLKHVGKLKLELERHAHRPDLNLIQHFWDELEQ